MKAVRTSSLMIALALSLAAPLAHSQEILFEEGFEDANLASRGWYDNTSLVISTAQHLDESNASVEFRFRQGASIPDSGYGSRVRFAPTETVYLSYWVRYSENWTGSNLPYHPHEFYFLTDLDGQYVKPAESHLTVYVEQNEGEPVILMQDSLNVDSSRIGTDLTSVTENRSVAGCNGDSDGYGVGDCYRSGAIYRNEKHWAAGQTVFSPQAGPYYQADWHFVEAYVEMNSVVAGIGQADGVFRMWHDGVLIMERTGIMMRTGEHPTAAFNQFLLGPYMSSSPVDQTFWVDELTIATGRFEPEVPVEEEEPPVDEEPTPVDEEPTPDEDVPTPGDEGGEPDPTDPSEPGDGGTSEPGVDEQPTTDGVIINDAVVLDPRGVGSVRLRPRNTRSIDKPRAGEITEAGVGPFAVVLQGEVLDGEVACNASGTNVGDASWLLLAMVSLMALSFRAKRLVLCEAVAKPAPGEKA